MHGRVEALLTTADLAEWPDFKLGAAAVSPARRTVTGPGGSTVVEPRIMQVLVVLADADGAVVTREALLRRCWGDVYVGDDSLNRAVAGVRRVASGVAAGSFEIETVPRTGYRLVAPPDAAEAPVSGPEDEPHPSGRVSRRWLLGGGLAAAATAGGIAFWASRPPPPDPAARLIEESRIAMRSAAEPRAIKLLEQAVVVSPDSAAAWGLLALTRARADEHAITKTISPAAAIDSAAHRALALDPGNADAKAALAIAIPYYGDWLAAERRFDAVLAQHPDHLATKDSRSFLFGAVGRMRESAQERLAFSSEASFDADLQYRHIYALWFLGRIAEADRVASRGLEMWPGNPGIWFGRFWLLADTGRFDRALAHIDDQASRPPLPGPMIETLKAAMRAAASGRAAEIEAASERVMAGVGRSVAAVVQAMMLLNLMKATDQAFDLARAYYLEQGPVIAAMQWRPGQPIVPDQRRRKTNMLFTPTAAPMQRDPRFMPLMEEMGLADYWKRRGIVPDFLASGRA
jgi:DNA-binding winged helix-turn-helix (wHTH) protein/tetratricopeptide (TPR) repeat protein